jgi:amidase
MSAPVLDAIGRRQLTAVEVAELVRRRAISAREAVDAALRRLEDLDPTLRAFREVWPADARRAADAVDRAVAKGEKPALAGVPIAVKAWDGLGSPQARALVAAGCVPIGSTAVPSRAHDWQTWGHTDRGPTANPWRLDRSPGGSSAGSAVAVAAGVVPLATGTDGAGSTRIPAEWCGVLGVKPTNRAGLRAGGPLARATADAAAYLRVTLGTVVVPARAPLRAAWSSNLGYADTDPEVAAVARAAADRLADAGVIAWVPAPLALLDPEPAWRAMRAGEPVPAARAANNDQLAALFGRVDVLLTPTAPGPPHGHDGPGDRMNVSLTWAFNVSGHPAASVPAGLDADGLPVGLQCVADDGREDILLRVAAETERLAPWPAPPEVLTTAREASWRTSTS